MIVLRSVAATLLVALSSPLAQRRIFPPVWSESSCLIRPEAEWTAWPGRSPTGCRRDGSRP